MTELARLLVERIRAAGPMTLADYMAECLLHPVHGYYTTHEPFGAGGDFTTAPEISQMFGELLGLALAQYWLDLGRPAPFTLAELGPGRGTLMVDLLRATKGVPGFHAAAQVVLVEASPRLRDRQRQALGEHPADWVAGGDDLPEAPLFLIANEFFDALPIRQFVRQGAGWAERMVGLERGALAFGLMPPAPVPALAHRLNDTSEGEVVEVCPQAGPVMHEVARRIGAWGGLALIVDYGGWRSRGDTFQALRGHAYADPLAGPGTADLTAHVDFEALAQAAGGVATRCTTQGALLKRLGIAQRTARLAAGLGGAALEAHLGAERRLTHPQEMGELFKAFAVFPSDAPTPPGFA